MQCRSALLGCFHTYHSLCWIRFKSEIYTFGLFAIWFILNSHGKLLNNNNNKKNTKVAINTVKTFFQMYAETTKIPWTHTIKSQSYVKITSLNILCIASALSLFVHWSKYREHPALPQLCPLAQFHLTTQFSRSHLQIFPTIHVMFGSLPAVRLIQSGIFLKQFTGTRHRSPYFFDCTYCCDLPKQTALRRNTHQGFILHT